MYNDAFLNRKLKERLDQNSFRKLRLPGDKIDFCSNDYLGIVKNDLLRQSPTMKHNWKNGSTGSRLLSGNYPLIEEVEKELAVFHEADAALLFNSGYDANMGVISSIPQRGDTIIYDQLCHASIRDGIRLSFGQSYSFAHNDLDNLERKIKQTEGNVFVVTESLFSMDGDLCPLQSIVALCEKYNAHLIIDEAHATGIIGEKGEGLVQQLQLQQKIFCRIHTFGKAVGCHGAVVLGSQQLKDYLINFARSFIYSTSLPEHSIACIKASYTLFPLMNNERAHLKKMIEHFQQADIGYKKFVSDTPVQVVVIPGNDAVKNIADSLQANKLDVRAILYPTVPKGAERLRIVLHAFNTIEELDMLISHLKN
ncbi:8-amino-7-oxononanoate synthase [Panacibacter ginsenosidivorans]|uniref:8-amino-7-oxononanoate synthase n=1 Tax=Panacibacter ginsenosidivorans TaxID=1813871 RepID=A0A5B8V4D3_9BACT|nr:8-amino-7-oxononanoate synthase [Panacibacter ginsenosidivorans]QEC66072.1 8-amino-7-oxononanoate synthase [Panacibacter ginsenosidivorans]